MVHSGHSHNHEAEAPSMSGNSHTSIRSRQVAAELRTLREQADMSGAEVAKLMGMSPSKISRIETGVTGLQIEDVAALLGLYKVPASTRDELLDLVRRSEETWLVDPPTRPAPALAQPDRLRSQGHPGAELRGAGGAGSAPDRGVRARDHSGRRAHHLRGRAGQPGGLSDGPPGTADPGQRPAVLRRGGRGCAASPDWRARGDAPAAPAPARARPSNRM